jgi:hypothetical protein
MYIQNLNLRSIVFMRKPEEGQIIFMVFVCCLKEDIQCAKPLTRCKNCNPTNFEAHISRVVYTNDKEPLLGIKYFVDKDEADARKAALTQELAVLARQNN